MDGFLDESYVPRGLQRGRLFAKVRHVINSFGAWGITALTLGRARSAYPFAVQFTEMAMPLRGAPGFEGFRIVQFSDLHTGTTPVPYLREVARRINELKADLVVVTGDLVTHSLEFVEPACDIVASLAAPKLVIFGNHDYAPTPLTNSSSVVAEALQAALRQRGVEVLRNAARSIERSGSRLWFVGLEDYWSGFYSPAQAFAGLAPGEPVIALSHNPDTGPMLARRGAQWILAGHTHGGQIRLPLMRPLMLPIETKRFAAGLFELGAARMYVSRGVGFRVPVRFRCPPEVTTFVVRAG